MSVHVAATAPYAWPYDGRLHGEHVALLLAGWDAQWRSRVADADGADRQCARLAGAIAAGGGRVLAVAHHGADPLTTIGGTEIVGALGIDGFHQGPLDGTLRAGGITHLLVAGHGIEAAVHSTLRSANDRGYECLLVTDACSSLTDDLTDASAKTVTMSGGIFGAIGTTDAVLAALASQPPSAPAQED